MSVSSTLIGDPARRDCLLLVSAFGAALPTSLEAVCESLGIKPLIEIEHQKDADALAVMARMHALRTDPEHA